MRTPSDEAREYLSGLLLRKTATMGATLCQEATRSRNAAGDAAERAIATAALQTVIGGFHALHDLALEIGDRDIAHRMAQIWAESEKLAGIAK